jgi:pectinesterase
MISIAKQLFFSWLFFSLLTLSATAYPVPPLVPDITVASDGSGNFKTVSEALASLEITSSHRVVIFIRDGVYSE